MEPKNNDSYNAVVALLTEHPKWRVIVAAALEEAKSTKGGRFAGAWVLNKAKQNGVAWIPNLRKLVAYGILHKEGESARGGRRSYYSMPDEDGVARALNDMPVTTGEMPYAAHEVTDSGVALRSTVNVPYFANLASCGSANMSEEVLEDYMQVDTRLAKPGHQYFLVRASGDSMNTAGINNGDLVLVRVQNHADIGQKIVARLDDGTTIKELQRQGDYTVLMPRSTNTDHKPIILTDNLEVQGVVIATIPSFQ